MSYTFYLAVGTQHLYGEKIFRTIEERATKVASFLSTQMDLDAKVEFKALLKTADEITSFFEESNVDKNCTGVIVWMHTFSPSKMWIRGLNKAQKPILHLHTQFHKEIPWDDIDMDFMNLNQAAHGDREHGAIYAKMRKYRKVVSGHYTNEAVVAKIENWMRAAIGVKETKELKVVRFGDNMRNVAVTEGDKVSAEIELGYSVNGWGIGDLKELVDQVSQNEIREQLDRYKTLYDLPTDKLDHVEYQARLYVGMRKFLDKQGAKAFTTTFEDLHGLEQLPGLASQELMREGFGFGAEGDWKTSALLRIMKVMSIGKTGGNTFMEDYTYHLPEHQEVVLGAHMLEVCPSIAATKPKIEVHKLGIGGKDDPARAIFTAKTGKAIQVTLLDLGNRFRMVVADCEAIPAIKDMPKLPVASALWKLEPDFSTATEAWLIAGGAHHTVMSYDLDAEIMKNYADILGIEFVHISKDTNINDLEFKLQVGELIYK